MTDAELSLLTATGDVTAADADADDVDGDDAVDADSTDGGDDSDQGEEDEGGEDDEEKEVAAPAARAKDAAAQEDKPAAKPTNKFDRMRQRKNQGEISPTFFAPSPVFPAFSPTLALPLSMLIMTDVLSSSRAKLRTDDDDGLADNLLTRSHSQRHETVEFEVPAVNVSSARQQRKLRTAAGMPCFLGAHFSGAEGVGSAQLTHGVHGRRRGAGDADGQHCLHARHGAHGRHPGPSIKCVHLRCSHKKHTTSAPRTAA
jgi:hypothetical protein